MPSDPKNDPNKDLDALFGLDLQEDLGFDPRPKPLSLFVDLGVKDGIVELEYTGSETRAALLNKRPRILPELTTVRPRFYWVQYNKDYYRWDLICYTLEGEKLFGFYDTALEARERMLELRRVEHHKSKKRQALEDFANRTPTRLPRPPYHCICRREPFDSVEELLTHEPCSKARLRRG